MTARAARADPGWSSGLVVPATVTGHSVRGQLLAAVEGTPFELFWLESLEGVLEIGARGLPVLVGPRAGPPRGSAVRSSGDDRRREIGVVFELLRKGATVQLVTTTTPGATPFLKTLMRSAGDLDMLFLPRQADALRARLAAAAVRRYGLELERWLLDRVVEHPLALRLACHHLLRSGLAGPDDDPGELSRVSVTDVAEAVGVSRGHLFELQREHGVKLTEVARTWSAALAVLARRLEGAGWEGIAWRCGYDSMSGLSNLFQRVFGERLRSVERRPDRWVDERVRGRMVEAIGVGHEPDSE